MKKKILIIGKRSFIGSNLFKFLKKNKMDVSLIKFKTFIKKYHFFSDEFDYIINSSSNSEYVRKKYQKKYDYDLFIAKKITTSHTKLIILGTRKIYKPKFNIKENDIKSPMCNYSKNKLITETLVKKILKNNVLMLRIANIIGISKKNKRKLHKTFIEIFLESAKKGLIYKNKKTFKDFISIKKFCEITLELIKKNASGTYNVSLGKKIYLDQITKWLNLYNTKKLAKVDIKKSFNNDSFTLNNKKLMNKITITNNLNELKKECIKLSKFYFVK